MPRDSHYSDPAGPAARAADAAREITAAVRRGDEPGAEQALSAYLARSAGRPGGPAAAGVPPELRELVLELAEMAADAVD